ncbi:MAG: hypothetical protein R8L07_07085 [Alphaproteobacteria bacterium]|nr:hypothetical protein [Alphaproteobacteria bacterium]
MAHLLIPKSTHIMRWKSLIAVFSVLAVFAVAAAGFVSLLLLGQFSATFDAAVDRYQTLIGGLYGAFAAIFTAATVAWTTLAPLEARRTRELRDEQIAETADACGIRVAVAELYREITFNKKRAEQGGDGTSFKIPEILRDRDVIKTQEPEIQIRIGALVEDAFVMNDVITGSIPDELREKGVSMIDAMEDNARRLQGKISNVIQSSLDKTGDGDWYREFLNKRSY